MFHHVPPPLLRSQALRAVQGLARGEKIDDAPLARLLRRLFQRPQTLRCKLTKQKHFLLAKYRYVRVILAQTNANLVHCSKLCVIQCRASCGCCSPRHCSPQGSGSHGQLLRNGLVRISFACLSSSACACRPGRHGLSPLRQSSRQDPTGLGAEATALSVTTACALFWQHGRKPLASWPPSRG